MENYIITNEWYIFNAEPDEVNAEKEEIIEDVKKIRAELIRLSEDGEIEQSIKHIKNAWEKVIRKIYAEYELKQAEKTNCFLTDMFISKFSSLLGGLDAIESGEELDKELQNDKLLRRDVKKLVERFTPFLPFLEIISGGVTVGKHVIKNKTSEMENDEKWAQRTNSSTE